jgi:hypothetical protein
VRIKAIGNVQEKATTKINNKVATTWWDPLQIESSAHTFPSVKKHGIASFGPT